jgi:hypothetical protein
MTTILKLNKIDKGELQSLVSGREFRDIVTQTKNEDVFVIGKKEDLDKRVPSYHLETKDKNLVDIEVALRRCKRVGFFKVS